MMIILYQNKIHPCTHNVSSSSSSSLDSSRCCCYCLIKLWLFSSLPSHPSSSTMLMGFGLASRSRSLYWTRHSGLYYHQSCLLNQLDHPSSIRRLIGRWIEFKHPIKTHHYCSNRLKPLWRIIIRSHVVCSLHELKGFSPYRHVSIPFNPQISTIFLDDFFFLFEQNI